jgi:hypothetical protein
MMQPKRLTDEGSEATSFERELLVLGQNDGLSAAQKQEAWSNILVQLSPLTSLPPAAATAKLATSGGLFSLKMASKVIGVAALVGAVGVGYVIGSGRGDSTREARGITDTLASPSQESSSQNGRHASDPSGAPSSSTPPGEDPSDPSTDGAGSEEDQRVRVASSKVARAPSVNKGETPSERSEAEDTPASRLREESLAVLAARRTLRTGDAGGALRLLEAARRDFPSGMLGQEREALTIEALARSGAKEVARKRADTFLSNYPKSPYASDVRAFASKAP